MEQYIPQQKPIEPYPKRGVDIKLILATIVIGGIAALIVVIAGNKVNDEYSNSLNNIAIGAPTTDSTGEQIADIEFTNLPDANNYLGFNMLSQLIDEDTDANVFISPVSIETALLMTMNGAEGNTYDEMAAVLGVSQMDLEDIKEESLGLMQLLTKKDEDVEMSVANSIWGREDIQFKEEFLNVIKDKYMGELESVDFSDPSTVDQINNWIEGKTNDKIKDMLDQSAVNESVVLILVNAIYFNGTWTVEFNEEDTQEKDFTLDSGDKIKVDMMYKEGEDLLYFENDSMQMVELPYGDGTIVMYVLLPKNGSIDEFIRELSNDDWGEWISGISEKEGTIEIPKFKLEYGTKSLKAALQTLGMKDPFAECSADFSKMSDVAKNNCWYISDVLHKSFIDVNEKGTEAAAATAVVMLESAAVSEPDETFYFNADRPFVYAISDKDSGAILFLGVMKEPEYE